jgi:acyl carrier protein
MYLYNTIYLTLIDKTKQVLQIDIDYINPGSTLCELNANYLDQVEIILEMEKVFKIDVAVNYPDTFYNETIRNICEIIHNKIIHKLRDTDEK